MRVLQLIDLLQKSELEKVYFCACGMSFCKTLQKPKNAKKSFKITVPDWGLIFEAFSLRKRNSRRYATRQQFQEKTRPTPISRVQDK